MSTAPSHKQLIFLTGFMGSGKSTIGPILANTLGLEYCDIDRMVEAHAKMSVAEIFASEGEAAFRSIERTVLEEVAAKSLCVVALGGGSIASEENYQLVHRNGLIVYLQLSPEEILQRVRHRTDRPLLRDADGARLPAEELERKVLGLLKSREVFYQRADIVVPSDRLRVGLTVDEIVRRLRGRWSPRNV